MALTIRQAQLGHRYLLARLIVTPLLYDNAIGCVIWGGVSVFRVKFAALAGCVVFLHGCAAATVTPVRMSQPGDESLSCEALQQEIAKNTAAAEEFVRNDKRVRNANVAKGVGSAIPAVGILLIGSADLSNKEQIQGRALVDRDERLTNLSKQKNCAN